MLAPRDVLVLAPGVHLESGALVDDVRQATFALNAAGVAVVENEGRELRRAIDCVAERWEVAPERAERDVLAFAWTLNAALLANVRRSGPLSARVVAWAAVAAKLLPLGIAPPVHKRRHHLETRSRRTAVAGAARATGGHAFLVTLVTGLALAPFLTAASSDALGLWAAVAIAAGVGIVAHEAAHASGLRGVPAALVVTATRVSVLHPLADGRRARRVALLGPAAPAVLAVILTSLSLRTGCALGAAASCPLGAHAVTATIAGRDGRAACRS